MFFAGSRYANQGSYTVQTKRGLVTATVIPLPRHPTLQGYHRRHEGQRLDHIADRYLADPDTFFQLCDASGTLAPDALAARDLVGIPVRG